MKAKIKKWWRIKQLERRNTGKMWEYADTVEYLRLTNSKRSFPNASGRH